MAYLELWLIRADEAPDYRAAGWQIGSSSTPGYCSAWRMVRAGCEYTVIDAVTV